MEAGLEKEPWALKGVPTETSSMWTLSSLKHGLNFILKVAVIVKLLSKAGVENGQMVNDL